MEYVLLFSLLYFNIPLGYSDFFKYKRKFLYFAYGSNLLDKRIHMYSPSAVFVTPAKLPRYRLDFNYYIPMWRGAVATVVEDSQNDVWGALWAIDYSEINLLDRQEDILYYPKHVKVVTPENHEITARTYQLFDSPSKVLQKYLPTVRRPSDTYLQVIAIGAYQCGIPNSYNKYINKFPTNGLVADATLIKELGYPFNITFGKRYVKILRKNSFFKRIKTQFH